MENIFENAYFGKLYKTRDGRRAVYLKFLHNNEHHLYVENTGIMDCTQDGLYISMVGRLEDLDIISEWQEPIDEDRLDKLAKEYEENYPLDDSAYSYYCYDGFKAGYRKAKEDLSMKRVSFKVAKAIKEAGYPQIGQFRTHDSDFYAPNGEKESSMEFDLIPDGYVYAPFYLEVWLWLWREKKINVIPEYDQISGLFSSCGVSERDDPEEAIIAAIEYLVDKNLIK